MKKYFGVALAAAMLGLGTGASAQWSIGAPGTRVASQGHNRYFYFVFANPLPGREAEFNDWYLNTHLGDLVQLDGWIGAQRFRLAPLAKQLTANGYQFGYAVLWDQEGDDPAALLKEAGDAIGGGKSRRGAGFNYGGGGGGGSSSAAYQVVSARITRADGVRPFIPAASDNQTPRPNRFTLLEFVDPPQGMDDTAFETALDARARQILTVPGWMAAQRLRLAPQRAPAGGVPAPRHPKMLVMYEVEAGSAQQAETALEEAIAAGKVTPSKADPTTAKIAYWEPISPYITKDDFER